MSSCNSSTTEDSPGNNNNNFHSATEELDEPVGPPPTATDESTTVQSPHRMDQQETRCEDKYNFNLLLLCLAQSLFAHNNNNVNDNFRVHLI